jgi:hypothetical protein
MLHIVTVMAILFAKNTLYNCVAIYKGVIMSVNFGYGGYGMGMNQMTGNQMGINQGGGIYQSIAAQYSCPVCYQRGVVPYNLQTNVNPLPPQAFQPSWFRRIFGRIFG